MHQVSSQKEYLSNMPWGHSIKNSGILVVGIILFWKTIKDNNFYYRVFIVRVFKHQKCKAKALAKKGDY